MHCACAIFSSVVCPGVPFFSTLFHKRHDFRKKITKPKMCVLIYSTTFVETFLILRRKERDTIKNVHRSSCKVRVILVRFKWNLNFLNRFWKNNPVSNFMKICPVGAKLFMWTYRRTDMTQLIVAFRNIAETPETLNKYAIFYQTDIKELQLVHITAAVCH